LGFFTLKKELLMTKLRKVYFITAIAFLGVLAISPLKDYFSEWRAVQKNYNRYIKKLPQKIKPAPLALNQIWVPKFGRVDRCVTCHTGMDDGKLANAPLPFRSHSQIPHETGNFGCTICHNGQGLATNYKDAHLPSAFWDKPVLPNRYLESSCGRCHINENLKLTPTLNLGRQEIRDLNCVACHDLSGGYRKSYIPSLNGIGNKIVSAKWLAHWLKNPREMQPQTKMPDFLLSNKEVEILNDFLMSFKSFSNSVKLDSLPEIYVKKKEDDNFITSGKTRFSEARCISCHAVEGKGGHLAPDLAKIASKATAEWIFNYIKNVHLLQPGVEMPQYGFSIEEIAEVTAYIESEFVDRDTPKDTIAIREPPANFFEQGIALFNKYNCGGCHDLSSEKVSLNRGPDLTGIGSKKIYQIDFGTTGIPHTLYDYIDTKISSPRTFGASARMPQYQLSRADNQAITTALLSWQNEPLPQEFMRTVPQPPKYDPQGKVGQIIQKYSCLKCHTINQTGGTVAPDLSIVGSQLQQKWVESYFKVPYSLRPIMEERMPNLFIADDEIETLTDYFFKVLINDSLSVEKGWDISAEAIARGQGLFREKYGCQSCHIAGGNGGYVGPPLDKAGNRLTPGWIYHWLLNPQKYKPETLEPRAGLSGDEAKDITAYLMSLKSEK
jgi:mono/diheme cytochrome c family protein